MRGFVKKTVDEGIEGESKVFAKLRLEDSMSDSEIEVGLLFQNRGQKQLLI